MNATGVVFPNWDLGLPRITLSSGCGLSFNKYTGKHGMKEDRGGQCMWCDISEMVCT